MGGGEEILDLWVCHVLRFWDQLRPRFPQTKAACKITKYLKPMLCDHDCIIFRIIKCTRRFRDRLQQESNLPHMLSGKTCVSALLCDIHFLDCCLRAWPDNRNAWYYRAAKVLLLENVVTTLCVIKLRRISPVKDALWGPYDTCRYNSHHGQLLGLRGWKFWGRPHGPCE